MIQIVASRISIGILLTILLVSPWMYGGVLAIHQFWAAVSLVVAVGLALIATMSRGRICLRRRAPLWGMCLLLLMGAVQLVPLPPNLHRILSSQSRSYWETLSTPPLTDEFESRSSSAVARYPLSVYPAGTFADLALWSLPAVVLLLAMLHFGCSRSVHGPTILALVALNGAIFALFGIVQQFTGDGKLYWRVELAHGVPFAAFVNRNHAGAYLNLCLAAGLGLLIWLRERPRSGGWIDTPRRETQLLVAVIIVAICASGIVLTLSRSAAVAALSAAAVLLVLAARLRQDASYRNSILTSLILGVIVATWLGGGTALRQRFEKLSLEAQSVRGRLLHWQDAARAIPDFWKTGAGLGTYRYAYQPYEDRYVDGWFYHAENQYLEALIETGVLGLLWLLLFLGFVLRVAFRNLRSAQSPAELAISAACVFGLVAVSVQALFDFNLYMPAVAMLTAMFVALTFITDQPANDAGYRRRSQANGWVCVALVLGWLLWSTAELRRLGHIESASRATMPLVAGSREDPELAVQIANDFEQRSNYRERDVAAHVQLAELRMNAFRSLLYAELKSAMPTSEPSDVLWELTEFKHLHGKALDIQNESILGQVLREHPLVQSMLRPAFRSVQQARRWGPLWPRVHVLSAELSFLFEPHEAEEVHRQRCLKLRKADPSFLFPLGMLDLQAQRHAAGVQLWKYCLELSPKFDQLIITNSLSRMSMADFARDVLPDHPMRAVDVVVRMMSDAPRVDDGPILADALQRRLHDDLTPAESAFVRGTVDRLRGQLDDAISWYMRAVELRPADCVWRMELARLLLNQGNLEAAHEQAVIASRLDPQNRRLASLLDLVNRRRRATNSGVPGP